jgi:hypothetical protein
MTLKAQHETQIKWEWDEDWQWSQEGNECGTVRIN